MAEKIEELQKELANYYASRIAYRAGLKKDMQLDLESKVKQARELAKIDKESRVKALRKELDAALKTVLSEIRKAGAAEKRAKLKEVDSVTNAELGKMKNKLVKMLVEDANSPVSA